MIRRTLDPAFLNRVANHPDVRPWVGGDGVIDVTPTLDNPANIGLVSEFGGFLLIQHEPGIYEVHSMFLPEGRGRHAVEAMRAGQRYMFTRTDCVAIQTKVPHDNRRAAGFAKIAGFQPLFERGDTEHSVITVERWMSFDRELEKHGHWFHERLEQAKTATGSALPVHDDDASHDRAVGAAVLMAKAGNAAKGVWLYNRWARLAGYACISLISDRVIDVVDAVVEMTDDMEVLLCR